MPVFLIFRFLNMFPRLYIREEKSIILYFWISYFNNLDLFGSINRSLMAEKLKSDMQLWQKIMKDQYKVRNLAIKVLLGNVDKNICNLDQSLEEAINTMQQQLQSKPEYQSKEIEYKLIRYEVEVFVEELRNCPGIWLKLIEEKQIDTEGNKLILNKPLTITEVYEQIIKNVNQKVEAHRLELKLVQDLTVDHTNLYPVEMEHKFNFEECYCDETVCNLLAMIINYIAEQIVVCYEEAKAYIIEQTQRIEQLIKKSPIMNSYVLFSLLKQMSKLIHKNTKKIFLETFDKMEISLVEKYCRYIQTNYQVVHFHYVEGAQHRILSEQQKNKIIEDRNVELINMICDLGMKQVNPKVESSQIDDSEQKVIKQLLDENSSQDKKKKTKFWKLFDIKDSISGIYKAVKNSLEGQVKAGTEQVIENELMDGFSHSASIGGSLGKCLVDIDQYENVNQFFGALSKTAMIGGSITLLLEEIPIFNYFIIAGGLSYTVYKSYKDEITSSQKKMKNIGNASIVAVGSVGSTATGMVLGQILIPIPFLGGFVGGMIGGYFGQKGSRQLTTIMNNQNFMKVITYLQQTIISQQHWQYSDKMLQKLGVSKKYFEQTICPKDQDKNIAVTIVCFFVVAYYQSRKQAEFTQHKLEQSQNQPKKQSIKKILFEEEDMFKSQFNTISIVEYLSKNKIYLVDQLEKFQPIVQQLIT